jgi:hypothetical protein
MQGGGGSSSMLEIPTTAAGIVEMFTTAPLVAQACRLQYTSHLSLPLPNPAHPHRSVLPFLLTCGCIVEMNDGCISFQA